MAVEKSEDEAEETGDDEEAEEASEEGGRSIQLFEKVDDTKLNTIIAAWPMLETRHNYSADKLREMYEKLVYYGKDLLRKLWAALQVMTFNYQDSRQMLIYVRPTLVK